MVGRPIIHDSNDERHPLAFRDSLELFEGLQQRREFEGPLLRPVIDNELPLLDQRFSLDDLNREQQ